MILICCVDDNMGMAFNHRRQSQDRLLRLHLIKRLGSKKLWMSPYSAKQFGTMPVHTGVSEDWYCMAEAGEFCLVELELPPGVEKQAEGVVLYRWNRVYPADVWFDLNLNEFYLTEQTEFAGFSHPKITEEIYCR